MFSNKELKNLIVPLFLEQLLTILVGLADTMGKGLRAAGDIRFTMVWSMITTIGVRLLFSLLFAIIFDLGVIGVAIAMCLDWCTRAVIFYLRFQSGTWKQCQLIKNEK